MIDLSDYVNQLRQELEGLAEDAAKKQDGIVFKLDPIELELTMVVEKSAELGGNLTFKIFGWGAEANAGGDISSANTQKLKLKLTPVAADGGDDTSFFIHGTPNTEGP